ncbi:MAG: TolC family protein [Bacteroidales bacterium]|jgi:outer membrane protein TolC|nr:TolC family protein [Bacteroidales bacterium]
MKKIVLHIFLLLVSQLSWAQKSITIDECWQKARENYPLIRQHGLVDLSERYTVSNIGKIWLPQISVNAQASYQSDVVHLPVDIPGMDIPVIDKDQYKVTVDLSQTIWDGGTTRSEKKITRASHEVDKQQIEVSLYTVRERIDQLFFGILTIDEQLKQLDILNADLDASMKVVTAYLQNGTATSSDVDAVRVELLNTEQRRTELISSRKAYAGMLSAMINETVGEDMELVKPVETSIQYSSSIRRPEMLLYASQGELFQAQEHMINVKNMPRFSLFLQGGYGKPGLNMLANEFDFFYIGGIRFSWNFGNLYSSRNDRNLISFRKNMILAQQETFVFNTNLKLTQVYHEIQKAKELMERDDEIILLRERVKKAGEGKYENGVYTVNDLVKDINVKSQAQQAKVLHEIQYLMSIYQYKMLSGNNDQEPIK